MVMGARGSPENIFAIALDSGSGRDYLLRTNRERTRQMAFIGFVMGMELAFLALVLWAGLAR